MTDSRPALIVLTPRGLALARRLQVLPALRGAEVHGLEGRAAPADLPFRDVAAHLRGLFRSGRPLLGFCAAGVLIRALAPCLADKRDEPPVLALAEDGSAVVPLLGGHRGANRLARAVAAALDLAPALTTAGDVGLGLGLALDEPPAGWRVADSSRAKRVAAALLAGTAQRLSLEAGDAGWLSRAGLPLAQVPPGAPAEIRVTDRIAASADPALVLHPPVLALGIGCERDASPADAVALVRTTLAAHGLAETAIALVASLELKADEPAVHAVAAALGAPARFFTAAELQAEAPRLRNPSEVVRRAVGCPGVAEGAALAAAGPQAELLVEKTRGARITVAVARAPAPLDAAAIGRPRGRLLVLGIGPGDAASRTGEVAAALAGIEEAVGYGLYLDLLGPAIAHCRRHATDLGAEEARARRALDLAAEGRQVGLISSGDAGIYALAALVFELLDRDPAPGWARPEVLVLPGLSALQVAAARAGAPLGHDFCAISLSDLLTPWPVIERRLQAAAEGDFVTALYNPASARRRAGLQRALAILGAARPADTPVVRARNLGRAGESATIERLDSLDPDGIDMLTLLIIGSSTTRAFRHGGRLRTYTPRGYAAGTPEPGHTP